MAKSITHLYMPDGVAVVCGEKPAWINSRNHKRTWIVEFCTCSRCKSRLRKSPQLANQIARKCRVASGDYGH